MSRTLLLPFVLGALYLALGVPRAQACTCLKERSELVQQLARADLVVFGTISALRTERGLHHLTVQIAHALKGATTGERIEIVTATDDGGCGVKVAVGESYLLWPFYLSWPGVLERQRAIDTCNGGYRRMAPAEFEGMRAELEAAAADPSGDAGADEGDAGNAVSAAQAASAPTASDDEADGCALGGARHDASAAWFSLSALALAVRSRSRRRRSPAPAP